MSLHEEITVAMQQEIEVSGNAVVLMPTTLALAIQRRFDAGDLEPHIKYTSLEHLKQIARRVLSGRYDADSEENETHQGELFSGQLQDRYPIQRTKGSEPQYKLRWSLTAEEVKWNLSMLRKSAAARLEHADALQAWEDDRNQKAA